MDDSDFTNDQLFTQLILSLQMGAMQQMGKFASPITGKIERDLPMAKASIDMLAMLEVKTKGNLTEDEEKMVKHILYELRLNYVDELKKKDEPSASPPEKETKSETEESAENQESSQTTENKDK